LEFSSQYKKLLKTNDVFFNSTIQSDRLNQNNATNDGFVLGIAFGKIKIAMQYFYVKRKLQRLPNCQIAEIETQTVRATNLLNFVSFSVFIIFFVRLDLFLPFCLFFFRGAFSSCLFVTHLFLIFFADKIFGDLHFLSVMFII
jgi:hypothetical protein